MTLTPAYPTPAIPCPLSVRAAMIPAMAVPWPFGSVVPAEASRKLVPGTSWPARSGCEPSTPVSRSATTALPLGTTVPKTLSQPIFGSDHWLAYPLSLGVASAVRTRSSSTLLTLPSARRVATTVDPSGTLMTAMPSTAIESVTTAPAAARVLAWVDAEVPVAKVTMYPLDATGAGVGTGVGAGVGVGVGSGVGSGVGAGVGTGVGAGVGSGVGAGVGSGVGTGEGAGVGLVEGTAEGGGLADGSAADTNAGPRRLMHRSAICPRISVERATRQRRDEPVSNIDVTPAYCCCRRERPRGARYPIAQIRAKPGNAAAMSPTGSSVVPRRQVRIHESVP